MDESSTVVATKRHTESNEQIAAMDWLRAQHPNIALHTLHIGNERKASYYAGYIMKRMGVLKGASDLFMAWPNGGYHGLFIEVKSKIGRPSPEQKAFLQRMSEVGYRAEICYGAEEVISTIKDYLSYQGTSSSSMPAS
jgi:hypothetical protein